MLLLLPIVEAGRAWGGPREGAGRARILQSIGVRASLSFVPNTEWS